MKKIFSIFSICFILIFTLTTSIYAANIEYKDAEGKTVKLSDFLDTQGHWAHDTILRSADFEWISGYNGKFMPNDFVKRGDLALIIDRMLGLKTVSYNFFTDLSNDAYYRESLLKCVAAGYISGTGSNTINPTGYATREQVATIICRIFDINFNYNGNTGFIDDSKISSWAKSSVYAMKRLGYMNGNDRNEVNPTSNITRAELVTILTNVANTYIPKSDKSNQGDTFKNQFPTNVVTSRNITLVNSEVGRDLVLTQSSNSLSLQNTVVKGRLLVLAKNSINLSSSSVSQIVLLDGKTDISGISENVDEVYISSFASESSLNAIPKKLVLESGVRVRIDNIMYENLSGVRKEYNGADLRSSLADDQGYIVGGPKVLSVTFSQDIENLITVSNVKISAGNSDIKEVGVIWLNQDKDEDIIIPLIKNKDGISYYNSDKYAEPFSFNVGTVKGIQAFRLFVKDKDGLYAYSDTKVFTAYDFDLTLKLIDNDYPAKVDLQLIVEGDNIPEINSIRAVHDVSEYYSDTHSLTPMRLHTDADAEVQPDKTKYRKYVATLMFESQRNPETGTLEYKTSTAFGYIINFANGNIINRFPILNNSIPSGYTPVSEISTGDAYYNGTNSLNIINNKVNTKYVVAQEVGVIYKTSTSESIDKPSINSNGWTKVKADVNLDLNMSVNYNVVIPIKEQIGYTYYCSYVKMSNGYWYGTPKKILNTIQGDKNGPVLSLSQNPVILSDTTAIAIFKIENVTADLNLFYNCFKNVTINNTLDNTFNNKSLFDFNHYVVYGEENGSRYILLEFSNLAKNSLYNITLQIADINGLKSNILGFNFDTSKVVQVDIKDRYNSTYGGYSYHINTGVAGITIKTTGHYLTKFITNSALVGIMGDSGCVLNITGVEESELSNLQAVVYFEYMPEGMTKSFEFTRVLNLK